MLFLQILIDGFAISSLYALGATGFTLIFGVSGVLNLSHGAIMVSAAVAAWAASGILNLNTYAGAMVGVATALVAALATYFVVVLPIQKSRRIPTEEKEIFVLTATLLWGIMLQELIAYFFTNNAKTVLPIIEIGLLLVFRDSAGLSTVLALVVVGYALPVAVAGRSMRRCSLSPRPWRSLGFRTEFR